MKTLEKNLQLLFVAILLLISLLFSCTKQVTNTQQTRNATGEAIGDNGANPTQNEIIPRRDGIFLYLHTMIEWTDAAHSLWRRVYFGSYNDIIIEVADKTVINESWRYQYILFDYVQKQVKDIITVNGSSSPLVFYKSRLPGTLLLENYEGSQRYKYVYNEGVSTVNDTEFVSLFNGKYISESPKSNAYIVSYISQPSRDLPEVANYVIDESNFPQAWTEGLNGDYKLLEKLNARVYNSDHYGSGKRPTDWKIFDNKYVFMINSDENSNPCGDRAYYAVRTLDNQLVFTVPEIMVPALKYELDPLAALHDTLIDFSADKKRVLIKGMYNDKLCVMIYDIVTYEEWTKKTGTTAERLTFGNDLTSPLQASERIDAKMYSVEPGHTKLYGVIGNINFNRRSNLYAEPSVNSNVIMEMKNWSVVDRYKHDDKDGVSEHEMMCFEIINRTETKTMVNGVEVYWYQIIFDSAMNWERPNSRDVSAITLLPEMFTEYTGWVPGNSIIILDWVFELRN
ncbi:MAG: hypothetical protein LBI28_10465 [Treponema sp.]|jgi:hypothetical protein|nr:hypothetical protein [Treponema sp.]